ncbi:hypothetical protein LZ30DRAFT_781764 [Colletotrichum cereale]|nr:hypothetical protein LZ30DRAFT_781764 [Colletotrichum cereale]
MGRRSKVLIMGSNGETLGVPYLGLAADLHKDVGIMFQYPTGTPRVTSTRRDIPIAQKSNFTFDLDPTVQDFRETASWMERDWMYPPVAGQAGFVGAAISWAKVSGSVFIDPSVDGPNDTVTLLMRDVSRDILGIAPAKYRMRYEALVPFRDPKSSNNWVTFETLAFEVLPL